MDVTQIVAPLTGRAQAPGLPSGGAMEAAAEFARSLRAAEDQGRAAVTTGADPHALVTAMAESKLAVEMVVATRDRVVEAYQEILRMPV